MYYAAPYGESGGGRTAGRAAARILNRRASLRASSVIIIGYPANQK